MATSAVCFGEILWDVFADGRVSGGATMNVAIRLQSLGVAARIISRTGRDAAGDGLREIIQARGVDASLIQYDDDLATSEVRVSLDPSGNASYDIVRPTAWDRIGLTGPATQAVAAADAFVFGSLAFRDEVSKRTLQCLLPHARYRVFDLNLRPPSYDLGTVEALMRQADLIKLNQDELDAVAPAAGDLQARMRALAGRTGAGGICVSRGGEGALLLLDGRLHACDGFPVAVADTVGAGDSFLAALLAGILQARDRDAVLAFACRVGAAVAARRGANPELSADDIAQVGRG